MLKPSVVLNIGGLDPSAGAGILRDISTIEHLGGNALGVCTAVTYQNHWKFFGLNWLSLEEINRQLDPLLTEYKIDAVKIGLIENLNFASQVISKIKSVFPESLIIWDPIIKSSSGFTFHDGIDWEELNEFCFLIDVVTPNLSEAKLFRPQKDPKESVKRLSLHCNVIVTSYSKDTRYVTDCIVQNNFPVHFTHPLISKGEKHGSGCVFSSSLAYFLTQERDIYSAYKKAKDFTGGYLESSESLVGEFTVKTKSSSVFSNNPEEN